MPTTTTKSAAREAGQNPTELEIGDRVGHGHAIIRSARDYWLGCGQYQQKSAAQEELKRKESAQGTVTNVRQGKCAWIVTVKWDDGRECDGLGYAFRKL